MCSVRTKTRLNFRDLISGIEEGLPYVPIYGETSPHPSLV